MLSLLIDFPQKLKFGKTRGILITLFYLSLFSPKPQDFLSSLKTKRIITPQQVIRGNALNLA